MSTMQVIPTDPTATPFGPDRIEVEPLHLSITQEWDSGSSHNTHLLENGDLAVILARGQQDRTGGHAVPHDVEGTGLLVIALGVDDDHDEVHYQQAGRYDLEELLGQVIETLVACREVARRVRDGVILKASE